MHKRLRAVAAALVAVAILIACWPASSFTEEQAAPSTGPAPATESPCEAAIRKELAKETTLELSEKSLEMAVKYLQQKHHIEIIVDREAFQPAGLDPAAARVSIDVHGISLRSALRLMLEPLNLTCVVRDEVLQIVPRDTANTLLVTEVYDVRDLVSPEGTDDRDFDSLIELLTAIVSPASWNDKGGNGSCQPGPLGTLVVLQSQEIQGQIKDLLAALRHAKAQIKAGKFDEPIIVGATLANKKIELLLADKIDLSLDGLSLNDVFRQIGKQKSLPVWIDQEALKQAGIDPAETLIVKSLSGISLKSALKLILRDFNMTTVIKDEVLQVTTKDKAGSELSIRLYPIGDLVAQATDEQSSTDAGSGLVDNISSTVQPESWSDKGGQGSIEAYGADQPVLVIAQTDEAHYGVADVLAQLRVIQRKQKAEAAGAQKDQPERLVLKIYPIRNHDTDQSAMTPQEVAEAIQGLVQPNSWSQPDIYIRGFTGKLVVRQTPAIHREIDKLLDKIEAKPLKPSGGGGGGF